MTKNELRTIYLAKRRELTDAEVKDRSERITSIFFQGTDFRSVAFLHVFLPIRKNNEPDTWMIIREVQKAHPEISIVIPRIIPGESIIEHHVLDKNDPLITNFWGIPEPTRGSKVETKRIDMVLVPLLCFDLKGNRVGYGKGFYDRFLSECRPDCQRIGLSMFEAVDQITDADAWDVPLHRCVTPNMIMSF